MHNLHVMRFGKVIVTARRVYSWWFIALKYVVGLGFSDLFPEEDGQDEICFRI